MKTVRVGIICEGIVRSEREVDTIGDGCAFADLVKILREHEMVPRKFTVRARNAWAAAGYATLIGHPVTVLPSSHSKFTDLGKFVESNDVLVLDVSKFAWKSEDVMYVFEQLLTTPRAVFLVSDELDRCISLSADEIRRRGASAVDRRRSHGTDAFYRMAQKKRPAPEPVDPAEEVTNPTVAPNAPRRIRRPVVINWDYIPPSNH